MKKRFTALLCLLLMLFAWTAAAEEAELGWYARNEESQAREAGREVRTETSFEWGGLPLLDAKLNEALQSLLKTLRVTTRTGGPAGAGYVGADVYLQDVSVVDMTMLARDGVYYEQTNLLGGQTTAFTREEFLTFTKALSERSDGVLPANLSWMYELVTLALGGGTAIPLDAKLIDGAIAAFDAWETDALLEQERLRPSVSIPGIYGARAVVTDVTRAEALMLTDAFVTLVSGENALWESAVRAQLEDADENRVREVLAQVEEMLTALPETVEALLPESSVVAEYREIYGLDDTLVAKQAEITLAGDVGLLLEWIPAERGIPTFFTALTVGEGRTTLLVTRENGAPTKAGSVTKQQNRYVAEFMLEDAGLALNVMMVRSENYELREGKETVTTKTDWMFESEQLLGKGTIVTVTANETDTATGTGDKYARKHVTDVTVKGLGFDKQKVLTVTSTTALHDADARIDPDGEIVRPAQLTGEELDAWVEAARVSAMQVFYTCLGRLPASTAVYVLTLIQ